MEQASEHHRALLSYRSTDRAVVGEFATRLRRDGVDAGYDHWEIMPGDGVVAKMDQIIDSCAASLIFISRAWFDGPYKTRLVTNGTLEVEGGQLGHDHLARRCYSSGVVSILAFLFAVWVWLKSDIKVRELTATIQALHDIADSVIWETQVLPGEDSSTRLVQAEKCLGLVSAMRTLSSKYVGDQQNYSATELGVLIHRGVVWSNNMTWSLEKSSDVREAWFVSHDLEPDLSSTKTGSIVKGNLATGKRYVYFYPSQLNGAENKIRRLLRNIGADDPKRAKRVVLIPLEGTLDLQVFSHANVIMFFRDEPLYGAPLVFQEVILTKVSNRGVFWQEHDSQYATELFEVLRREVVKSTGGQREEK